jgi:uncharacterized protein (TIGR02145 family)
MLLIFLAVFLLVYLIFYRPIRFQCPQCGHIQKPQEIIDSHTNSSMVNGRITKSGGFDKRYNTQFEEKTILTYKIDCVKCKTSYTGKSDFLYSIWKKTFTSEKKEFWDYLKIFLKAKKEGKEEQFIGSIKNVNSELGQVWQDYNNALDKQWNTFHDILKRRGLDTANEEEFMKKYGIKVDSTKSSLYKEQSKVDSQISICNQVWMTYNLNVDKFRNGDPITETKTSDDWKKASVNKQAAWCYFDNDPNNEEKYGKLYNFYAVIDPRGLAPEGWHIPSESEWTMLIDCLGKDDVAAGKKMKSEEGWVSNNGNNQSGFSGFPGGYRYFTGAFISFCNSGYWWSSTEYPSHNVRSFYLDYSNEFANKNLNKKEEGLSVRCVRD